MRYSFGGPTKLLANRHFSMPAPAENEQMHGGQFCNQENMHFTSEQTQWNREIIHLFTNQHFVHKFYF